MKKLTPFLAILLLALLYSLLWSAYRRPHCPDGDHNIVVIENNVTAVEADAVMVDEEALAEAEAIQKAAFEDLLIYFKGGSTSIIRSEELNTWLENSKTVMNENPEAKLKLTGHSDNTGSAAINLNISKERAEEVARILTREGFDPARIVTDGRGLAEPIGDNETPEGRAKNRRVAIDLIK